MPDPVYGDSITTGFGDYPKCACSGCMHEKRPDSEFCSDLCRNEHARTRRKVGTISAVLILALLVPLALLLVDWLSRGLLV